MKKHEMEATPAASAAGEGGRSNGFRVRLRAVGRACRQVFGIPDYERYLEHMAEHHPGAPVLSRQEFSAGAIDRKYGKGGQRCC
jgi:uncharacterized short protein YbdD (DUF466 family)